MYEVKGILKVIAFAGKKSLFKNLKNFSPVPLALLLSLYQNIIYHIIVHKISALQSVYAGDWGIWLEINPSDECPLYKAAEMHTSNLALCMVECRNSLCAVFSYHADTSSCHLAGYPGVTACDGSGYVTYTTEGLATTTTSTTSTTITTTTTTTAPTTTTQALVNLALGKSILLHSILCVFYSSNGFLSAGVKSVLRWCYAGVTLVLR